MGLFDKKKNKEVEEQPTEEIVILEAELDDDDPDAPMGTLVSLPEDEKQPTEEVDEEAPVEEESIEENEEIVDETPTEETTEELVEEEISEEPQEEEPTIAEEVPIEESAQEEVAEEETPIEDEAPVAEEEPVQEEPAVEETPVEEEKVDEQPVAEEEQTVEETPIEEPIEEVQEEPVAEEEKEEPAQEEEKVEEVKQPKVAAQQIAIDASPNDGSQDKNLKNDLDNVLGTDYKVEEQPKPAPAPKKIAAPAKKDNKEIWGKVVFTKKEEPKKEDEPKKEPAKKAPAKKAEPKKVEKVEEAPVKKAPAKKEEVKEEQPEAAPVKETKQKQNKNTEKEGAKTMAKYEPEKIVTAGDASQPHGKFVIRKTDNDNFVFKLISSNKRVVAIGAQAYTGLPGVKGGIQSVIKNAAKAPIQDSTLQKIVDLKFPKWEIWVDKKGEFRLRLYASNGELVASTNDGYTSKPAAKNGIDAIARACIGCDIVRNDDPKAY